MLIGEKMLLTQKWFAIDEKLRFVIAGMVNMGLRYLIFVALGVIFSVSRYQLILLSTWLLSSGIAFALYKYLVFRTEGNHLKEFAKSVLIWVISYIINAFLLALYVEKLKWNTYAAQAVAVAIIVVVNYLLFKYFAFHHRPKSLLERIYNLWD